MAVASGPMALRCVEAACKQVWCICLSEGSLESSCCGATLGESSIWDSLHCNAAKQERSHSIVGCDHTACVIYGIAGCGQQHQRPRGRGQVCW